MGRVVNQGDLTAYEASSSSNICKLLFTVQDSPRFLQRAHGEPLIATLHLTFVEQSAHSAFNIIEHIPAPSASDTKHTR
jgi:hypothetical protein